MRRKKPAVKPVTEPEFLGPLARTRLEIERGPHCLKCGRLIRFIPHECKA